MVTAFFFFVWLLFFDQHDLITQIELKQELNELETTKAYYEEEIEKTEQDLNELLTNDEQLERFAREKYLMKKPNEEIFVIVPKEE